MIYRTPIGSFPFKTQHLKFSLGHSQRSPGYLASLDNRLPATSRLLGFGPEKSFTVTSGLVGLLSGSNGLGLGLLGHWGQWRGRVCGSSKMESLVSDRDRFQYSNAVF